MRMPTGYRARVSEATTTSGDDSLSTVDDRPVLFITAQLWELVGAHLPGADLVDTVERDGVGDLATFAELRLGDAGRRFVRLMSTMTSPVDTGWCVDFALPGFEDLLRLAAEMGGLVVSFLVDGRDGDRWLGVNLDPEALLPLLT